LLSTAQAFSLLLASHEIIATSKPIIIFTLILNQHHKAQCKKDLAGKTMMFSYVYLLITILIDS
jgi:hypothetical protein